MRESLLLITEYPPIGGIFCAFNTYILVVMTPMVRYVFLYNPQTIAPLDFIDGTFKKSEKYQNIQVHASTKYTCFKLCAKTQERGNFCPPT